VEEWSMLKTLVFSVLSLFGCVQAAWAVDPLPLRLPLCPDWSQNVETDIVLWQALETAYPSAKVDAEDGEASRLSCLFPYKLLRYDKLAVLITLAGEPGEACHGCPAEVSAVFLRQDGNALKPLGRHDSFDKLGTFGDLIGVDLLRLGTEEGMVVESGGTFQGYSSTVLNLFLIRDGRMKPIGSKNGVPSGSSDCLVRDPCREVTGYWQADGRRFLLRHIGVREDGTKVDGTVVYELRKGSLVRVSGHQLAREMEESRP
jgi:hypothetical protein